MKKKIKIKMQANKPPKGKRKNIIKELFCVNNKFDFMGLLKNIAMTVVGGIVGRPGWFSQVLSIIVLLMLINQSRPLQFPESPQLPASPQMGLLHLWTL